MQHYLPYMLSFLAGVFFVAVGCGVWWFEKKKKRLCTAGVTGVVKSIIVTSYMKKGKMRTRYTPTFAYSVEGVDYVQQSSKSSGKSKYSEGQEIPIFYDPAKPDRYYIPEEATHVALLFLLIAVGVLLLVAPLYSLLVQ
jgi:Protein of unknown function (DUF3592).